MHSQTLEYILSPEHIESSWCKIQNAYYYYYFFYPR